MFSNKGKSRGAEDDGDYATLRELPLVSGHDLADDSTSEENKVSVYTNYSQVLIEYLTNFCTFSDLLIILL